MTAQVDMFLVNLHVQQTRTAAAAAGQCRGEILLGFITTDRPHRPARLRKVTDLIKRRLNTSRACPPLYGGGYVWINYNVSVLVGTEHMSPTAGCVVDRNNGCRIADRANGTNHGVVTADSVIRAVYRAMYPQVSATIH